jgi:hypothetical protein
MVAHKNINFSRKKKKEKIEFNQAHYLVVNLNKMCFGIKFFPFKVNNKTTFFFWLGNNTNETTFTFFCYPTFNPAALQPQNVTTPCSGSPANPLGCYRTNVNTVARHFTFLPFFFF